MYRTFVGVCGTVSRCKEEERRGGGWREAISTAIADGIFLPDRAWAKKGRRNIYIRCVQAGRQDGIAAC